MGKYSQKPKREIVKCGLDGINLLSLKITRYLGVKASSLIKKLFHHILKLYFINNFDFVLQEMFCENTYHHASQFWTTLNSGIFFKKWSNK